MKKSVIALAMVLALGAGTAAVVSAHGWNGGGPGYGYGMMNGGGPGYGMMNGGYGMMRGGYGMMGNGYGMRNGGYGMRGFNGRTDADDANYNKFLDQTTDLRKSIAVDRAELNALMAGDNPDPKRVRELSANIVDNQEKIAEMARSANVDGGAGYFCNGPGFGRRN